jgi:hypothetical protein
MKENVTQPANESIVLRCQFQPRGETFTGGFSQRFTMYLKQYIASHRTVTEIIKAIPTANRNHGANLAKLKSTILTAEEREKLQKNADFSEQILIQMHDNLVRATEKILLSLYFIAAQTKKEAAIEMAIRSAQIPVEDHVLARTLNTESFIDSRKHHYLNVLPNIWENLRSHFSPETIQHRADGKTKNKDVLKECGDIFYVEVDERNIRIRLEQNFKKQFHIALSWFDNDFIHKEIPHTISGTTLLPPNILALFLYTNSIQDYFPDDYSQGYEALLAEQPPYLLENAAELINRMAHYEDRDVASSFPEEMRGLSKGHLASIRLDS